MRLAPEPRNTGVDLEDDNDRLVAFQSKTPLPEGIAASKCCGCVLRDGTEGEEEGGRLVTFDFRGEPFLLPFFDLQFTAICKSLTC